MKELTIFFFVNHVRNEKNHNKIYEKYIFIKTFTFNKWKLKLQNEQRRTLQLVSGISRG